MVSNQVRVIVALVRYILFSVKLNVFPDLHISTANVVATGMADRPDGGRSENLG